MAFILSQQTVDSKSFLNPKNGWIVPDVVGIIHQMVSPRPQKIIENGTIKFSKDLTSYKDLILKFFFEKATMYRNSNYWKLFPIDHNYPVQMLKIFYKTGIIQYFGPNFYECKEFLIKNIFTDLEITESKITLTDYTYNFGTNIDFARFHPKLDPKLKTKIELLGLSWKILIKYSGITYTIFQSGKMVISCHNTNLSNSVLNYLNHLVYCYQTLERPLTF